MSNHWGILINSADATRNLLRNNRIHQNGRAGVAVLGVASGNTIEGNDATRNGSLNRAPSLLFDLFDAPPLDNTWTNNEGTFNFATGTASSSVSAARLVAEAFGPGGCLARFTAGASASPKR